MSARSTARTTPETRSDPTATQAIARTDIPARPRPTHGPQAWQRPRPPDTRQRGPAPPRDRRHSDHDRPTPASVVPPRPRTADTATTTGRDPPARPRPTRGPQTQRPRPAKLHRPISGPKAHRPPTDSEAATKG
ncbi:hypothetical protein E7X58_07490 [Streptomyces sp. A1499]|nr:hypothetical protein E7X58_07490 [Streptomyces sp. A1499]